MPMPAACYKRSNDFKSISANFIGESQIEDDNREFVTVSAGRTIGHERDQEGKYLFEGGSDRGGEGHGVGSRGGIMDSHQHQFCLKWNSFGSNLATAFSNLFKSESLTDVTLFCEAELLLLVQKHESPPPPPPPPPPLVAPPPVDGRVAFRLSPLLKELRVEKEREREVAAPAVVNTENKTGYFIFVSSKQTLLPIARSKIYNKNGVTFKAHRLILAACSKHFQELFEGMPPSPAGLIVILDGTSAHNMASLLEFMYRGEVHVSQESLSSFLKAAECLQKKWDRKIEGDKREKKLSEQQVKGLSIEHEKLAVAQRHAAESNNSSTDTGGEGGGGGGVGEVGAPRSIGGSIDGNGNGNATGSIAAGTVSTTSAACDSGAGEITDLSEAGEATMLRNSIKRCRDATPTPAPSPAPAYTVPNMYSHYFESPPKRLMRSPSDIDTLGRASVLRDGAAFRPASAPHPLLLENHFYQPFAHPSETPAHSHTAPHTPTELEQELEQARSEERNNCDNKESVAEDLRINQERMILTDRERAEKLAERLSSEVYSVGRGFEGYCPNSDHLQRGAQMGSAMVSIPSAHPLTPDLSPAPTTPAMWNTKMNKAGTVSTPEGSSEQSSSNREQEECLEMLPRCRCEGALCFVIVKTK
ncbi:zinc finger protein chinmo isoform X2 [Vespula squamosa]|uniref:Zinc finger protein chinmo isoform X2 n=1 Tax=Vespula squamosa TaxID=30214 RepID=A0ABD1ZY36_VESSQ